MDYIQRTNGFASKRPNPTVGPCDGEPPAKVSITKKRVRNRLQMKPDGSIVCETSVIEEVDDAGSSSRFNTSILGGEQLVNLELTQGDSEVDPLGDHVDGSATFQTSEAAYIPDLKAESFEVKLEDDIKTEDDIKIEEVFEETPIFIDLSPFESKYKPELDCPDIREPGDESASSIPVIDISEPIVRNLTLDQSNQPQLSYPLLSNYLPTDQQLDELNPVETLSPRCKTPNEATSKSRTANCVPYEINSQNFGGGGKISIPPLIRSFPKNTDGCPCIIETLLRTPFVNKKWNTDERKVIVMNGKPTQFPVRSAAVVIDQDKFHWITGCKARDELHCWPCLLFHPKYAWCSANSLLDDGALIHQRTFYHEKSVAMLDKLEKHFQRVKNMQSLKKKTSTCLLKSELPLKPIHVEDLTKDAVEDLTKEEPIVFTCEIKKLIHFGFSSFRKEEQDAFILKGRPRPPMEALAMMNRHLSSKFEYDKTDWLTGSAEMASLFCWPCLLFSRKAGIWEKFGFSEFRLLEDATARHETTQAHMDAYLRLKVWESEIHKIPKDIDNLIEEKIKETRRGRDFLKYVVDVTCFLKMKINNSSIPIDDYVDILKLISSRDEKLKYFVQEKFLNSNEAIKTSIAPYLKMISMSLQSLMLSKIKDELKRTPFMSLILQDTSVQDKKQRTNVAAIVRYITETGEPCERFVKFIKAATDRPITMFVEAVKSLMKELDCGKKMVGFTYDGGVVQSSMIQEFNNGMTREFLCSNFFQYREHLLHRLLRQSLSHLKCCRHFISGLSEISNFFENTPNAITSFLSMNGSQQNIEWDFSSGLVHTIMKHYCKMIKFFEIIKTNGVSFKCNVVAKAGKFVGFLLRLSNRFLVVLLSKIIADMDPLDRAFQGNFDASAWIAAGESAVQQIQSNNFDDIYNTARSVAVLESRIIENPENVNGYKEIYQQVINEVTSLISNRNSGLQKWEIFSKVPSSGDLLKYLGTIQNRLGASDFTIGICPSFDCKRLLPQLTLLCGNDRFFGNKDISALTQCLHDLELVDTVNELYKFLAFIKTVPMVANDFTSVPKIKKLADYIRGKKDLHSVETLLWMERDLLVALQSEMSFQDSVVDYVVREKRKKTVEPDILMPADIKK